MRELSLFTGAGGGIYGSKLLDWETVGYVEWGNYPQKVIAQRIKDGIFDKAPIFGDIRAFVSEGYARRYRGMVDIVTGGFPCQPFSVAGKREASNDERDMWPATLDVIKSVKPPVVFLENVPGLLSATVDNESDGHVHYFGTILRDLSESGYDVKWCVLGADDVNLPHRRKRLWVMASDTASKGFPGLFRANTITKKTHVEKAQPIVCCDTHYPMESQDIPKGLRVDDGLANRVGRTKAVGNGQVPLSMACAYEVLSNEFINE